MSSVRAFLAIPLSSQLQASIAVVQKRLEARKLNVRWARSDNLHLTLHFFARTTQETLEKIKVSMLSVKRCERPFAVGVNGLGAFPSLRRGQTLWLGLEESDRLARLHEATSEELRRAGVHLEARAFRPHLTIGRAREPIRSFGKSEQTIAEKPIGRLKIDRLVLFESRLHADGAEHIPLFTVNLDD